MNAHLALVLAALIFGLLGCFGVPGRISWAALGVVCLALAMLV